MSEGAIGKDRSRFRLPFRLAVPKLDLPRPGLWRRKQRPPPPIVLPEYADLNAKWRRGIARWMIPALVIFNLINGFYFALMVPFIVLPFLIPPVILAAMVIWALPDQAHAPVRGMERWFCAFFVGLVLWPNYLAIALPALPWITVLRLTGFPMALLLAISLSISSDFRRRLGEAFAKAPLILRLYLALNVLMLVTLPFSGDIGASVQKVVIFQINWTAVLLISVYVFQTPGRVTRYAAILWAISIPIVLMTVAEYRVGHVLWQDHVPSFLKVEEAARALANKTRGATGEYRAKATFSTPLGLAEYLALMTPIALHFMVTARRFIVRVAAALTVPAYFYAVILTDARLGVVGMLVAIVFFPFLWGLARWRRRKEDLIGPALVLAYPAIFVVAVAATFFVRRLSRMVWGDGSQNASNQARSDQWSMGFDKIAANPIGYGVNQSGETLGFWSSGILTVDSYYLTLLLEVGVLGFLVYFALMFLVMGNAVYYGIQPRQRDPEMTFFIPIATIILSFVIIKGVFSQQDFHPFIFMMVGMTVALIQRAKAPADPPGLDRSSAAY